MSCVCADDSDEFLQAVPSKCRFLQQKKPVLVKAFAIVVLFVCTHSSVVQSLMCMCTVSPM